MKPDFTNLAYDAFQFPAAKAAAPAATVEETDERIPIKGVYTAADLAQCATLDSMPGIARRNVSPVAASGIAAAMTVRWSVLRQMSRQPRSHSRSQRSARRSSTAACSTQ